jgi:glycyl-tRNA synthetase
MPTETTMDKLVALCKRRGFIFQSSEIYGGIGGFWDYGPLGVELKRNIKEAWWTDMVRNPPPGPNGEEVSMTGVDCAIIMHPKVWEASGHVGGFSDPMADCKETKKRYRADQLSVLHLPEENGLGTYFAFASSDEDALKAASKRFEKAAKKAGAKKAEVPTAQPWLALFNTNPAILERTVAPETETIGTLTPPRAFNLMFQTYVGAVQDVANIAYLRPETAQGIFANFKNVLDSSRMKLPFGIAQVGKAFRNEINPRNYTFRSREFEQMEIEFFCHPSESFQWYKWWRETRIRWYSLLGIRSEKLVPREQGKEELAHYSIGTTDIEYLFPFAEEPQELEGVAHRGAYDLTQHMKHSGKDLSYFDEELWEKDKASRSTNSFKDWLKTNPPASEIEKYQFVPHVIEPSAGADRFTLAVLCEAYTEDTAPDENGKPQARVLMKLHPRLAPIKAAILPLVNKDGMPERATKLHRELKAEFNVFYDDKGAVGRRYRRQDEAGTPFCFTIDGQTVQDDTVTVRDRDTLKQTRLKIGEVAAWLREKLRPCQW